MDLVGRFGITLLFALALTACGGVSGQGGKSGGPEQPGGNEFTPPTAEQQSFDFAAEMSNEMRQLQRQDEYLTPEYQQRLNEESMASFLASLETLAADPERNYLTDLCWTKGLPCAGDIRLYDWTANGYGLAEPVLFVNRTGAVISGHVWATRSGPAKRPVIVITSGSIQATEEMYWWAAQTLAKAGYVVLTTDAQNQGQSDTFGEGDDAFEGVPPQTQGNTFYDGTVDALDFMLSTPDTPYCPQPARSGNSHCEKQQRRVQTGLNAAYNPFWAMSDAERVGIAGHSYGANGVSFVGQQDARVDAIVAWDNLCHPDGTEGSYAEMMENRGLGGACNTGFQPPIPELTTPALGISNDYVGGPLPPQPADNPLVKSQASIELSKAGVDTGQIVIRGGTHFEYSYLAFPMFSATKRGIDLSAWYTVAWFDKYVKGDASADARLLTARWLQDPVDAELDPAGRGNMFSFYYRSRLDIHSGGKRVTCEDMEQGCEALVAEDGVEGPYSFLEIVTSPDEE